ncbi:sensor histidine kinase [Nakamurella silvestris]|nr:sensor histidine kinase [Nakamurella silvestris]
MAVVAYRLQAGSTRDRFVASALAGFASDAQQANKHENPEGGSKVDRVADFMQGRLGLQWAVVNLRGPSGPLSTRVDDRYLPAVVSQGFDGVVPAAAIEIALEGLAPFTFSTDTGNDPQFVVAGQVSTDLVLVEFYSTRKMEAELRNLRLQLGAVALVVSALALGLGTAAATRIQRRVSVAAGAAARLGAGDLQVRLPVQGRDEIADLAVSFNVMAARLGESIEQLREKDEQQQRFVADVAHDLRTPVASMLAAADSLDSDDPAGRERSAELVRTQARRMSALVADLLEMSRFDAGAAEFRPELVDLVALVDDAIEGIAAEGVTVDAPAECTVSADPRRLHAVVTNLISNALRHGRPPITVTIAVDPRAQEISVAVADSGPGVPAELAPYIFDRFTRGDRARAHTEGSGLGLAIVAENIRLHGGRLVTYNRGGAVFEFTLPRASLTDTSHG